jgi:hypothetical protein
MSHWRPDAQLFSPWMDESYLRIVYVFLTCKGEFLEQQELVHGVERE